MSEFNLKSNKPIVNTGVTLQLKETEGFLNTKDTDPVVNY